MAVSTFDLYKIGIGPSSSHTVGPMRAGARFVRRWLEVPGRLDAVARVRAEVFGSLALTGRGHGTDKAVMMGLEGHMPNRIDPDIIPDALARIRGEKRLRLGGTHTIAFDEKSDLVMNKRQKLPFHTNGMRFTAYDADGAVIATRDYYSVGGGFVVNQDEAAEDRIVADTTEVPHPFASGDELIARAQDSGLGVARLMLENEKVWRSEDEIRAGLREIWQAMQACVERGIRETGTLPGGLHVTRRAPALYRELLRLRNDTSHLTVSDHLRRDYKHMTCPAPNGAWSIGMASVTQPLHEMVSAPTFLDEVRTYARQQAVHVLMILAGYERDGTWHRELFFFAWHPSAKALADALASLRTHYVDLTTLPLALPEHDGYAVAWTQHDLRATRKQFVPAMKQACEHVACP